MKTEVQVMYQTLKRLEPNAPHVYGGYTTQLSHSSQQPNGSSGINLPPLNNPGSRYEPSGFNGGPPSSHGAAMQGVEYGGYGQAR